MNMNNKMKIQSLKKNNEGSALIVCIIILLFVSILATVILYMSGINYRMKRNELNTKISFYSGEQYLERMQSNLVIPVSEAMGNAYRATNSQWFALDGVNNRRASFYNGFNDQLNDILITHYAQTDSITNTGTDPTTTVFIKNIIHNLTSPGPNTGDGIPISQIYINDGSIPGVPCQAYTATQFVDKILVNNPHAFDQLSSDPDTATYYICVYGEFNQAGGTPEEKQENNYKQFIQLDVMNGTDLADPDKCRLLMKNICVVCVQNGYRSIISTDIAVQFPPLDWDNGTSADPETQWNVYQLIYYINWSNN